MDDLETELRDLSGWLETPDPPDVTARVRARLTAPARRRRRWRYSLAAGLAALLVAVLPPGRAAVADAVAGLLRFAGVTITTAPAPPPSGSPAPLPSERSLTAVEAQRSVRFPIRIPGKLGPPEQVRVADPDAMGSYRVATLLYRGGALRVDAFDGRLDPVYLKQAGGSGVELVQVDGGFAVWIDGPHALTYVDRTGEVRVETARLAATTLIWEEGGVTYRIEGDLAQAEAIGIAGSLS